MERNIFEMFINTLDNDELSKLANKAYNFDCTKISCSVCPFSYKTKDKISWGCMITDIQKFAARRERRK